MKLLLCLYSEVDNRDLLAFGTSLALHLQEETHLLGVVGDPMHTEALSATLTTVQATLAQAGLAVSSRAVCGAAKQEILAAIQDTTSYLIVVGHLGRSALLYRLMGPQATDLLDMVEDSILFVPPGSTPNIQHMLISTGGLIYSQTAVEMGARIARAYGARVSLLHIVHQQRQLPDVLREPSEIHAFLKSDTLFAHNFRQALSHLEEYGVSTIPRLRRGHPKQQLLAEIRSTSYDLVVIGSHHTAGSLSQLMGGISQSVMRQAGVPVLVARKKGQT